MYLLIPSKRVLSVLIFIKLTDTDSLVDLFNAHMGMLFSYPTPYLLCTFRLTTIDILD